MSYQQRSTIISFISSLIVTVPYVIYLATQYQNNTFTGMAELKFWAQSILFLIPVRILVEILMQILSAIAAAIAANDPKAGEDTLVDERDKLIDLKAQRNAGYAFILGFILSMVAVMFSETATPMFVILFAAGFGSEIVSTVSQLYYYQKGE
jgi:hypothetical protein